MTVTARGARTGGARGAALPLAFYWNSNEIKRLLCIAKVSHISIVSVLLPFSAVIPALVGLDSSF